MLTFPEEFYEGNLFIVLTPEIARNLKAICEGNGTTLWRPELLLRWIKDRLTENEKIVCHYCAGEAYSQADRDKVSCTTLAGAVIFYPHAQIVTIDELHAFNNNNNNNEVMDLL